MKTLNLQNRNPFASITRMIALLTAVGLSTFAHQALSAQTQTYRPINEIAHHIYYPPGLYDAGDEVTIEIHLDDPGLLTHELYALALELHLSPHAVFPTDAAPDFTGSWFASGATLTNDSYINDPKKIMYILETRTNGTSVSGTGKVVAVTLECHGNGISAPQLIQALDGGITIIENVEMRLLPPATPLTFRCYPNPVTSHLTMEGLEKAEAFTLYNSSGSVVRTGTADEQGSRRLDLSALPTGTYILRTASGKHKQLIVN